MRLVIAYILIINTCSYAQTTSLDSLNAIIINYDIFYNTDRPNVQTGSLVINSESNESVFIHGRDTSKEVIKKPNENRIGLTPKSSVKVNYFNFQDKKLWSKLSLYGSDYAIEEELPKMKWKLLDEQKQIGKLNVNKASVYFRGRTYIAWYNIDYPLKSGPWKFHGLPGVIVEIYDETKRFHWKLTSILTNKKISSNFIEDYLKNNVFISEKNIFKKKVKKITIKEYADLRYNNNSKSKSIYSRLPKGASVKEIAGPRNGFEIKFEWEE